MLSVFDREIAEYATNAFRREGISLLLNTRVEGIDAGRLRVVNAKTSERQEIEYGMVVWCSGIKMPPLCEQLKAQLGPAQAPWKSLATDRWLRVKGSGGTIAALGDCATIVIDGAAQHALELWPCEGEEGCQVEGRASRAEVKAVLEKAALSYTHLIEYGAPFHILPRVSFFRRSRREFSI